MGDAVHALWNGRCQLTATDLVASEPWLTQLDVRDPAALQKAFTQVKPELVLHLAAMTDVEECERDPQNAVSTNALGPEHVAHLCAEHHCPMVYISTAGVFDGLQDFYTEEDQPVPINVYGRSKYDGELAVQKLAPMWWVFRAGWMMGGGPKKDKKFVNKIVKQLKNGATELFVVDDKLGCPTYTMDFAATMLRVVESGSSGLFHMVGKGNCSRYDVAAEMLNFFNVSDRIALNKVDSNHFKNEYFAARPPSEQLMDARLDALNLNSMGNWKESLHTYLSRYDWGLQH